MEMRTPTLQWKVFYKCSQYAKLKKSTWSYFMGANFEWKASTDTVKSNDIGFLHGFRITTQFSNVLPHAFSRAPKYREAGRQKLTPSLSKGLQEVSRLYFWRFLFIACQTEREKMTWNKTHQVCSCVARENHVSAVPDHSVRISVSRLPGSQNGAGPGHGVGWQVAVCHLEAEETGGPLRVGRSGNLSLCSKELHGQTHGGKMPGPELAHPYSERAVQTKRSSEVPPPQV